MSTNRKNAAKQPMGGAGQLPVPSSATGRAKGSGSNNETDEYWKLGFPWKLHKLLSDAEREGFDDIISWTPNGKAFVVKDKDRFSNEVMPRYFRSNKFKTFKRSSNMWGFQTAVRHHPYEGLERGDCHHELFLRGRIDLCQRMARVKSLKEEAEMKRRDLDLASRGGIGLTGNSGIGLGLSRLSTHLNTGVGAAVATQPSSLDTSANSNNLANAISALVSNSRQSHSLRGQGITPDGLTGSVLSTLLHQEERHALQQQQSQPPPPASLLASLLERSQSDQTATMPSQQRQQLIQLLQAQLGVGSTSIPSSFLPSLTNDNSSQWNQQNLMRQMTIQALQASQNNSQSHASSDTSSNVDLLQRTLSSTNRDNRSRDGLPDRQMIAQVLQAQRLIDSAKGGTGVATVEEIYQLLQVQRPNESGGRVVNELDGSKGAKKGINN